MRLDLYAGAGNRFALAEASGGEPTWAELAREVCARELFGGARPDGLLVVREAAGTDTRMEIYNADGSRPEACGNGLRCVAWHLLRTGREGVAQVDTDAGVRRFELLEARGEAAEIYVEMGAARVQGISAPLPVVPGLVAAHRVNVGNPHCVLRVEDERLEGLAEIGRRMQSHPDFPEGVNVGLLACRDGGWRLRVFERGVGETEACGTGACAAVASLALPAGTTEVAMRGGVLRVRKEECGPLHLSGEARHHGRVEIGLDTPVGSGTRDS